MKILSILDLVNKFLFIPLIFILIKILPTVSLGKNVDQKTKKIVVAIIDTGVEYDHFLIKDNLYLPDKKISSKSYGIDFTKVPRTYTPKDIHGHGTHIAGIIKNFCPWISLLILKYYQEDASHAKNAQNYLKALKYAINSGVDIISFANGGIKPSIKEFKILKFAEKRGLFVVTSAGNNNMDLDLSNNSYYPSSYGLKNFITVSAHDKKYNLLKNVNWGKKSVDLLALGENVYSAKLNNKLGLMSGSSQSVAIVTGILARIKGRYRHLKNQEIKKILILSVNKINKLKNKSKSNGYLNPRKTVELLLKNKGYQFDQWY